MKFKSSIIYTLRQVFTWREAEIGIQWQGKVESSKYVTVWCWDENEIDFTPRTKGLFSLWNRSIFSVRSLNENGSDIDYCWYFLMVEKVKLSWDSLLSHNKMWNQVWDSAILDKPMGGPSFFLVVANKSCLKTYKYC